MIRHGATIDIGNYRTKKTLKRTNAFLRDITRTGGTGIGKTELLKGSEHGFASALIEAKYRLEFSVDRGVVRVVSCHGPRSDK